MQDPYRVLGIEPDASPDEIKAAYRRKSSQLHPDRNPDPEAGAQMAAINDAYRILSDPELRARYDRGESTQREPTIQEQARQEFFRLLHFVLDAPLHYENPIAQMIEQIDGAMTEARKNKTTARACIKKLRRMRKYVARKREGENLIHAAIDDKLQSALQASRALRQKILVMKQLRALVDEYTYTGQAPEPVHYVQWSNTASATSW